MKYPTNILGFALALSAANFVNAKEWNLSALCSATKEVKCGDIMANMADTVTVIASGSTYEIKDCLITNCPTILVPKGATLKLTNVVFQGSTTSTHIPASGFTSSGSSATYPGGQIWIQGGIGIFNNIELHDVQYLDSTAIKLDSKGILTINGLKVVNTIVANTNITISPNIDVRALGTVLVISSSTADITGLHASNIETNSAAPNSCGGVVSISDSTVSIFESSFTNVTTNYRGSAVCSTDSSKLTMNSVKCTRVKCKNEVGACLRLESSATADINNLDVDFCSSKANGAAVSCTNGRFSWNGGSCTNSESDWGACGYLENSDKFGASTIADVEIKNIKGAAGAGFFLNNHSRMNLTRVNAYNVTASNQAGITYQWDSCEFNIRDSVWTMMRSNGFGGTAVVQQFSIYRVFNVTIVDSSAKENAGMFEIIDSYFYSENSSFSKLSCDVGDAGAFMTETNAGIEKARDCKIVLKNTKITNSKAIGGRAGCFFLQKGSRLLMSDSTIDGCESLKGGGFAFIDGGFPDDIDLSGERDLSTRIELSGDNIIRNSMSAENGGVVSLVGKSSLIITGNLEIDGAQTLNNGAFFYGRDQPYKLTMEGELSMKRLSSKLGSFMYMNKVPEHFNFNYDLSEVSHINTDLAIFVQDKTTALTLLKNPNFPTIKALATLQAPPVQIVVNSFAFPVSVMEANLMGFPSITATSTSASFSNLSVDTIKTDAFQTLGLNQAIPNFVVTALNVFGEPADININAPVIVSLKLTQINGSGLLQGDYKLQGEIVKAILDPETKAVDFKKILIKGQAGVYVVDVKVLTGLEGAPSSYPILNLYIKDCASEEKWDDDDQKCLKIVKTEEGLRIAIAVIAGVCVLFCFAVLIGLLKYSNVYIIQSSSPKLLLCIVFGAILMFTGVIILSVNLPWSCVAQSWLENLGFVMLFMGLITRTYRILAIFTFKQKKNGKGSLSDNRLLTYVAFGVVLIIIFLGLWTALESPTPLPYQKTFDFYTVDRCRDGIFPMIALGYHIAFEFVLVAMAYTLRNVHADFNESKYIGFACYNWALVGAIFLIIAQAIPNPTIAFLLKSISIIIPNFLTVVLLCGQKLYLCITDLNSANTKPQAYSTTTSAATTNCEEEKKEGANNTVITKTSKV